MASPSQQQGFVLLPATARRVEKVFFVSLFFFRLFSKCLLKKSRWGNLRGPGQAHTVQHKPNPPSEASGRWGQDAGESVHSLCVSIKRGHCFVNAYWHKINNKAKGRGIFSHILKMVSLTKEEKLACRQIKWNLLSVLYSAVGAFISFSWHALVPLVPSEERLTAS